MDYEKKYKEALGRANAKIDTYNHLGNTSVVKSICEIFPELKESDGEQSKNWILEYLYDGLRKTDEQFKDQFKAAIGWLEKQDDKSDYNPYKTAIESISSMVEKYAPFDSNLQDFYNNVKVKCKDAMEYDKVWLEKQGEQKPIDKVEPKFKTGDCVRYRGENYKIKDIEITKNGFIYNVCIIGKPSDPEEVKTAIGVGGEKDIIKIEQESSWSEEDKDALDIAIRIIQNGGDDCAGILDSNKALNWLKSLMH